MSDGSDYERDRLANIARNREILAKLEQSVSALDVPRKKVEKSKAKPVQPRAKREREVEPTRQSKRIRKVPVDPNESPAAKRKREREEEELRAKIEEERLEQAELERAAKRPRHHPLDLAALVHDAQDEDLIQLKSVFNIVLKTPQPRRTADYDAFDFGNESDKEDAEVQDLRTRLSKLRVVSRAKVTQDRVYSATYHPEPTKDLILFGDKHGQVGIWDARAAADEVVDEDGEIITSEGGEGGKYWRLQPHWPATSRSSTSSIKVDPQDSFTVYTSSYDCTIRSLSLASGLSTEIFNRDDGDLLSCLDLSPDGQEMWIADNGGGLTHLDLRQPRSQARWYQLSSKKIGTVSVNPVRPNFLVTASNDRDLSIWDTRQLLAMGGGQGLLSSTASPMKGTRSSKVATAADPSTHDFDGDAIAALLSSKKGKSVRRANWSHGQSATAAFWDPRGRSIVSTSYDNTLRLWDISSGWFERDAVFPTSRPFKEIKHDCNTGQWVTLFRAQWTPNPDVYPHFTIGNMGSRAIDIFSCKGERLASLYDQAYITAVQAVTCSHPNVVERVASGNGSGRCVLWAPADLD